VQRDTFDNLEKLIDELNEKYRLKGEYENTLRQLDRVDTALVELNARLAEIDDGLFSEDAAQRIKKQIIKFNRHFSAVSYALYGEKYALKVDQKTDKRPPSLRVFDLQPQLQLGEEAGRDSLLRHRLHTLRRPRGHPLHALPPERQKGADARQPTAADRATRQREGNPVRRVDSEGQTPGGAEQGGVRDCEIVAAGETVWGVRGELASNEIIIIDATRAKVSRNYIQ